MTGSIVDHVERVRRASRAERRAIGGAFVSSYTPGDHRVAAIASRFAPIVQACRGVSLASCAIAAWCTWRLAKSAGAAGWLAAMAPLLFLACFGYTCEWYDIERSNTPLVALVALGAVAVQSERVALVAAGGAISSGSRSS